MSSHLIPFVMIWAVLAVMILALIVWRKSVASHEDDSLHVSAAGAGAVEQQVSVAHKLEQIDKWGKLLTVIAVVYGLILAGVYFYQMWVASSTVGM
jgi:hypothetical protein